MKEFLTKPIKEQVDALSPEFLDHLKRYRLPSMPILFTSFILFYGCGFDHSTCVQITSTEDIPKDKQECRYIRISGFILIFLLDLMQLFLDPISPEINVFLMRPDHYAHFDNLLFIGATDFLQPRDEFGFVRRVELVVSGYSCLIYLVLKRCALLATNTFDTTMPYSRV